MIDQKKLKERVFLNCKHICLLSLSQKGESNKNSTVDIPFYHSILTSKRWNWPLPSSPAPLHLIHGLVNSTTFLSLAHICIDTYANVKPMNPTNFRKHHPFKWCLVMRMDSSTGLSCEQEMNGWIQETYEMYHLWSISNSRDCNQLRVFIHLSNMWIKTVWSTKTDDWTQTKSWQAINLSPKIHVPSNLIPYLSKHA